MIRTIHVGVDGSAASASAIALGLSWAVAHGAKLLGHAAVAEPFITEAEAMPMGGAYFAGHRDDARLTAARARAQAALNAFATQCGTVPHETALDVGDPALLLHARSETADLTLLGAATYFHFENVTEPDAVLETVLHHPPRPVVIVPKVLPPMGPVVVAYDGSAEAARALFAFTQTGLMETANVIVVTVAEAAEPIAERAVAYLRSQGREATAKLIAPSKAAGELILEVVAACGAGLLVMGAFRHSTMHQFVFGSTTKRVLGHVAVPVFLFH